jgi:hypothetical protein
MRSVYGPSWKLKDGCRNNSALLFAACTEWVIPVEDCLFVIEEWQRVHALLPTYVILRERQILFAIAASNLSSTVSF